MIDLGAVFTDWRRTTSLSPILAIRSVANRYDVAFAGVFGW
jgi:hypothetical protein